MLQILLVVNWVKRSPFPPKPSRVLRHLCSSLHDHGLHFPRLFVSTRIGLGYSNQNILFFFFKDWLIDWLLCWVFVSVLGLSLVAAGGGHSSSQCAGLSLSWPLLLRSTGSRRAGSVVVAHGPSCSTACGIFPDQGSNLCPLHWQADSQPLCHQGSPQPEHSWMLEAN